jgi:hypothetical protein
MNQGVSRRFVMFRVENMGCDGDAGHEEDPRKSKKIAEFNADAMTLNVFRDEKKKEPDALQSFCLPTCCTQNALEIRK